MLATFTIKYRTIKAGDKHVLTASLNTDIISRKSSNVSAPSPEEENTLQIRSRNGLTYKK